MPDIHPFKTYLDEFYVFFFFINNDTDWDYW